MRKRARVIAFNRTEDGAEDIKFFMNGMTCNLVLDQVRHKKLIEKLIDYYKYDTEFDFMDLNLQDDVNQKDEVVEK